MQPRERSNDNSARFLSELRVLRDQAGFRHAELAARSHYPSDVLRAAEAGPLLPDLPVLSAFVRACGGEVTEWEDRWRALTGTSGPESLPMRPAGGSAAAAAGARAGAAVSPPEDHDPDHIMAVLARASDSAPPPEADRLLAATASPAPVPPGPVSPGPVSPGPVNAGPVNAGPVNAASLASVPVPAPAQATATSAANGSLHANGYPGAHVPRPLAQPVPPPRPVPRGGRTPLLPFAVAGVVVILIVVIAMVA